MTRATAPDIDALLRGDRAALARAITLMESKRADHRAAARALLHGLMPRTGKAVRVGITGVPGVGKSTLIDALGSMLTAQGCRVAVLAVDPSSTRTGGAILGDKTRMARLAADPNAYVRPSPTSGTLGGVAAKTRETMLLCEAAGFDVILVETVGVGQSETAVAELTDFFLVLMLPGAGDELQGIKRGILEVADMVAINKADGDNAPRATRAQAQYRAALHLMRAGAEPEVLTCSALEGTGIAALWSSIETHLGTRSASGELARRRRAQQVDWMWAMIQDGLRAALRAHSEVAALIPTLETEVREGQVTPTSAALRVLDCFLPKPPA